MLLALSSAFEDLADRDDLADLPVEDLVAAAGIARSTFYVYFEDKSELLAALAEQLFAELLEALRWWWALPDPVSKADVREAMERIADAYRSHRGALCVVVDAAARTTRMRDDVRAMTADVVREFAGSVRRRQAAGTIDPGLDAEATATWLVWLMERGLTQLVVPADAVETDRLLRSLTDLVWNILHARD